MTTEREQPYALRDYIVIPGKVQLTASPDYSHHCVLISPRPLHLSELIRVEGHQHVCHSVHSSACLFDCSNPRWEAWPDCVWPDCPLQLIETFR